MAHHIWLVFSGLIAAILGAIVFVAMVHAAEALKGIM